MDNPKILIRKGKKKYFEDLNKEVTIFKESYNYIKDTSKDFQTKYGIIRKKDLAKTGKVISSTKKEFSLFPASFIDEYKRLKRGAQIIPLKDIGTIITKTGINKNSIVIESGSGSGALSIFLSQYVKKIYSYDICKKHLEIVKENINALRIKNILLKEADAYKGFKQRNADLICLDLPDPVKAIEPALKSLKLGGFIVSYSPMIVQSVDFVNTVLKNDALIHIKTVEIIERDWEIDKRKVRPKSKTNIHSGFLSFARRIQ